MKSIKRYLLAISGLLSSFGTFAGVSFDKKAIVTNAESVTLLTTEQVKYKEENFVTPSVGWIKYGGDDTVLFESGDILFFSDPIARSSNGLFESFLTYDPEYVGDFGNCEQDTYDSGHLILLETNSSAEISEGNWIAQNSFYSNIYGGRYTSTQRINKGNFIFGVGECYDAKDLNGWEFYELNTGLKLKATDTMPDSFDGKYNPFDSGVGVCFLLQINYGWGQFIHYRNGFYCFRNYQFDANHPYYEEELTFVGNGQEVYILPLSEAEYYVQGLGYAPIELLVYRENAQSKTLDSISASLTDTSKTLYGGDTLNASDITVTPTYSDGEGTPITDGTGVTLNGETSLTLEEGNNNITVSYTDENGLGPVATTLNVNAEHKLTAEELAAEFNDKIDLFCDGGINPKLVGENSISSAWATAAEQYSKLSDEEKDKFNGINMYSIVFKTENINTDGPIRYDLDLADCIESGAEYIDFANSSIYDGAGFAKQSIGGIYLDQSHMEDNGTIYIQLNQETINNRIQYAVLHYYLEEDSDYEINTPWFDCHRVGGDAYMERISLRETGFSTVACTSPSFEEWPYNLGRFRIGCEAGDSCNLLTYIQSIDFYLEDPIEVDPTSEIGEMLGKYDYLYQKYGNNTEMNLDNFLERDVTPSEVRKNMFSITNIDSSTWIIVTVSLIGLTAVGFFIFYKKRKEN